MIQQHDSYQWNVSAGEQHAGGDAMLSVVGDKYAMMKQMGFHIKRPLNLFPSRQFRHWEAIFAGGLDGIEVMTDRLLEAYPHDFTERVEAESEVLNVLHLCGAIDPE